MSKNLIKSLNPIPSRGYSVGKVRKIIPDVLVEIKKNEIFYEINRASIPQINVKDKIEDKYYKKIKKIQIKKRSDTEKIDIIRKHVITEDIFLKSIIDTIEKNKIKTYKKIEFLFKANFLDKKQSKKIIYLIVFCIFVAR